MSRGDNPRDYPCLLGIHSDDQSALAAGLILWCRVLVERTESVGHNLFIMFIPSTYVPFSHPAEERHLMRGLEKHRVSPSLRQPPSSSGGINCSKVGKNCSEVGIRLIGVGVGWDGKGCLEVYDASPPSVQIYFPDRQSKVYYSHLIPIFLL